MKSNTKRKPLYPGIAEAEAQKSKVKAEPDERPDWINGAPNYDKFKGWDTERVLCWLNID